MIFTIFLTVNKGNYEPQNYQNSNVCILYLVSIIINEESAPCSVWCLHEASSFPVGIGSSWRYFARIQLG